MDRKSLEAALAKPLPPSQYEIHSDVFDPWHDVITGIFGGYSSESDDLMIAALEAVQDGTTFEFMAHKGFAGEFALYVLAGHGLTEYGTSPRGAWPDPEFKDLFPALIDKWRRYSAVVWCGE